jgi:sec-independent protein translocase protein TatA
MFGLGFQEIILLLLLGVLLFGRKLPDIGRSLGKTVVEFKKGIGGMEEEIQGGRAAAAIEPEAVKPPQRVTPSTSAPKFDDAPAVPASNLPPRV